MIIFVFKMDVGGTHHGPLGVADFGCVRIGELQSSKILNNLHTSRFHMGNRYLATPEDKRKQTQGTTLQNLWIHGLKTTINHISHDRCQ